MRQDVAAGTAAPGLDTAVEATPTPATRRAPRRRAIAQCDADSLKAEPGQLGPKHRKPGGGLTDALKSVQDTMSSTIEKITDGLKSGGGKTGDPSASEGGTGDTRVRRSIAL